MNNILVIDKINKIDKLIIEMNNLYNINQISNIDKIKFEEYSVVLCNKKHYINNISVNQHLILFSEVDELNIEEEYLILLKTKSTINIIFEKEKTYCITKEKSIILVDDLFKFINEIIKDKYFKTKVIDKNLSTKKEIDLFFKLIKENENKFNNVGKYLFGSIAIKTNFGFITTIRGKDELSDYSEVYNFYLDRLEIEANRKASLNSPLLFNIFQKNKNVYFIIHHHKINNEFEILDYASPGTLRDSDRNVNKSFNIRYHGTFELYDKNFKLIK